MARSFDVEMRVIVRVNVNDEDVFRRVIENIDNWREHLYNISTEDEVLEMLASNAVRNFVSRVNRLDGWADLPDDAATMDPYDAVFEAADPIEEPRHADS